MPGGENSEEAGPSLADHSIHLLLLVTARDTVVSDTFAHPGPSLGTAVLVASKVQTNTKNTEAFQGKMIPLRHNSRSMDLPA